MLADHPQGVDEAAVGVLAGDRTLQLGHPTGNGLLQQIQGLAYSEQLLLARTVGQQAGPDGCRQRSQVPTKCVHYGR